MTGLRIYGYDESTVSSYGIVHIHTVSDMEVRNYRIYNVSDFGYNNLTI